MPFASNIAVRQILRSTRGFRSSPRPVPSSIHARTLTGGPNVPISVGHYESGWKIDDIADFTKEGKYHIQTFNKISEKVSALAADSILGAPDK